MPIKKSFAAVLNVVALSAGLLMIAPNAEARRPVRTQTDYLGDSWNSGIYFPFLEKLARSPQLQVSSAGADQQRCDQFYSDINQKRSIKIILGLGYYDDSEGQPFSFNYRDDSTGQLMTSNFGMNATIDIAYVHMYTNMFTRKCHGDLRLCGFKEVSPGVFKKTVKNPQGQKVEAVIEMRNSSVTTSTALNMGEQAAEQAAKSEATTRWFFGSIPSADLVIYNGHSRKGGGPDFSPPKLLENFHVNYPYYVARTPGLSRLLEALSAPTKPKALMLMSCNSTLLFSKKIAAVAPMTSFVGTDSVIPGDIPTKGALAGMDSMLRFQCESGFNTALQTTPEIQQHITPLQFK